MANPVDTIVKHVEYVKHKIDDSLTIRISEDKYNTIDKFELSDRLRQMLGLRVRIYVHPIKHTAEEKIKLAMRDINEEKRNKNPDKKKIDLLTKSINESVKEKDKNLNN